MPVTEVEQIREPALMQVPTERAAAPARDSTEQARRNQPSISSAPSADVRCHGLGGTH